MQYQEHLNLPPQHSLAHQGSRMKGSLQETDIDSYDVLDDSGVKVGEVEVHDHTAIKGFARTIRLIHRDLDGKRIMDKSFDRPR